VNVQHRDPCKYLGRDQSTVGDDDTAFDGDVLEIAEAMSHRESQLLCTSLDRTGRELAATSAFAIRSCDDQRDVVTGVNECAKRRYRCLGRTEEARRIYSPSRRCKPVGIRSREFETSLTKRLLGLTSLIGVEPFDQQDTVEVVHLVLENAAFVLVGLHVDFVAVKIEPDEVDRIARVISQLSPGTERQPSS